MTRTCPAGGRILVLAGALAAVACEAPPGYVAREWSTALRELGVTPVFPPREDVQVGDIYFDPVPPEQEDAVLQSRGFVPLGAWVGRIDGIGTELDAFYGSRPSFPRTPKEGTAQPVRTGSVFSEHEKDEWTSRLRLVGFPMFMSATFRSGGLDALIPAEGVAAALGLSGQAERSVTVSVPRAESYGLPAADVVDLLLVPGKDPVTNEATRLWASANSGVCPDELQLYLPTAQRKALARARADLEGDDPLKTFVPYAYVRVLTEVFYARELDVQMAGASAAGGTLDATPPGAGGPPGGQPPAPAPSQPPATGEEVPEPAPPAPQPKPEPTPAETAAALNQALLESARKSVGLTTRFVSVSRHGVSLRTTFERPVAIGYRFVSLKLYADGRVEGAGSAGSAVPTFKSQASASQPPEADKPPAPEP